MTRTNGTNDNTLGVSPSLVRQLIRDRAEFFSLFLAPAPRCLSGPFLRSPGYPPLRSRAGPLGGALDRLRSYFAAQH